MDLFERLTRLFTRRKYSRVEDQERDRRRAEPFNMTRSKSVRLPRESRSERRSAAKQQAGSAVPLPAPQFSAAEPVIVLPKNFTLRSSSNDAIDGAWFNSALRRSVAEGRVTLS